MLADRYTPVPDVCRQLPAASRELVWNQFDLVPQQSTKKVPLEVAIVLRYCPGQFEGGLLARGNISHEGWLGKYGLTGSGC